MPYLFCFYKFFKPLFIFYWYFIQHNSQDCLLHYHIICPKLVCVVIHSIIYITVYIPCTIHQQYYMYRRKLCQVLAGCYHYSVPSVQELLITHACIVSPNTQNFQVNFLYQIFGPLKICVILNRSHKFNC